MSKVKQMVVACVVVLALGGLASASASATTAGWMVNGTMLSGTAALANTAEVTPGVIEAPESNIAIECTSKTISATGAQITAPEKGSASSLTFNGCKALKPEKCTLEGTTLSTVPLLLQEITLEGTLAVKGAIKPETKNTFATFLFLGTGCSISGVQPVTSSSGIPFLAPEGQDERTIQRILVNDGGKLNIGSSAAKVHFTILGQLASGQSWSFL